MFDDARAGFLTWSPLVWDPVGEATVRAAALSPGERVLDACCAAGSSALPAAAAVGPSGHVDAVDLAGALVADGRGRAGGLPQLAFHTADVTTWSGRAYHAVLCVFGVLLLPDMDAGGAHLAALLRPGGRMALTTWLRGSVEPLIGPFAQAVAAERGASDDVALDEDLAWAFVTGAGTRAMLAGLDDATVARVRDRYAAALAAAGTDTFHLRALVGVGHTAG